MLDVRPTFPLTDFLRNPKEMFARLCGAHKPVLLTVKGNSAFVIQDAESHQNSMDPLEKAEGPRE